MRPTKPLAVVLTVLALSAIAVPPSVSQERDWVPLAEATIHPGVQTVTNGGQCTANFVFTDAGGAVYIGQAAHCASESGSGQTNGCEAETPGVGTEVQIDGATQPGTMVYSSWVTMQQVGEQDPDACAFNDFALVQIAPDDVASVNPSLPFYGGPVGIVGQTSAGDTVYTVGNSSIRPTGEAAKSGTSQGQSGGGWTHDVRTGLNPGIPGDSGSGFVDATGRAFGVLSTLEVFPDIGANGVSDLSLMLAYLEQHSDLDIDLAVGTVQFDPDGEGEDTATGQPPAGDLVQRLAGSSRVETAVAVSQATFTGSGADAVVIGRADVAADALSGTPLAAGAGGPLLLTQPESLHPATEQELRRVLPGGAQVLLLGGESAISAAVADDLRAQGYVVGRLAGPSRIETAVAVAERITEEPAQVLLADGSRFPPALVAGPAAASADGVVLLTDGSNSHPAVDTYLSDHPQADVVAVGDAAATAYPDAEPIVADSDEALAVMVAEQYLPDSRVAGIARVDVFADALAGGAHIARLNGAILLSEPDTLSPATQSHLADNAAQIDRALLYGGEAALSSTVADEVEAAIAG